MPVLRNPKHELFAQRYAITGNARQSYIAAGYSEKQADSCASRLLAKNAKVWARIAELRESIASKVVKREIASRDARVNALQDIWDKMHRVIEARATHESMQIAPGGDTGLLVRQLKKIGVGTDAEVVEEFAVDTGLLKELRAHAEQAARELGQWEVNKGEVSNREIPPFVVEIIEPSTDDPND